MVIRPGQFVSHADGRVYHPYLARWRESAGVGWQRQRRTPCADKRVEIDDHGVSSDTSGCLCTRTTGRLETADDIESDGYTTSTSTTTTTGRRAIAYSRGKFCAYISSSIRSEWRDFNYGATTTEQIRCAASTTGRPTDTDKASTDSCSISGPVL